MSWQQSQVRSESGIGHALSESGSSVRGLLAGLAAAVGLWILPGAAGAAVVDLMATDVTPKAFSVVWASDEAVTAAAVHVFSDAGGVTEVTGSLSVAVDSDATALANGVVKLTVSGAAAATTYYIQADSTGAGGTVLEPAAGPFAAVTTATRTVIGDSAALPVSADVLAIDVLQPDGLTAAAGALVIGAAPGVGAYPVSAFVGDGVAAPTALLDLAGFYDSSSGENAYLGDGAVVELGEFRGLICAGLTNHRLTRLRRAPEADEATAVTEIDDADPCYSPSGVSADFVCDGRIGGGDFNLFLAQFGLASPDTAPDCLFNSDFDLADSDRSVGASDFTAFQSVFGSVEAP